MTSHLSGWNDGQGKSFQAAGDLAEDSAQYNAIRDYVHAFPGGYTAMRAEPARMLRAATWSSMFSSAAGELWSGGPGAGGAHNKIVIDRIVPIQSSSSQSRYDSRKAQWQRNTIAAAKRRGDAQRARGAFSQAMHSSVIGEPKPATNFWSNGQARARGTAVAHQIGLSQTPTLREFALFHGTSKSTIKNIVSGGFQRRFKQPTLLTGYGALGWGTYFSDNFAKCATYTQCLGCGSAKRCGCHKKNAPDTPKRRVVLLCKVSLGHCEDASSVMRGAKPASYSGDKELPPGFDSRSWIKQDGSEYMVADDARASVTHLIYYHLT